MPSENSKQVRRVFDVSAVPGGPQGQFPRQLIAQIEQILASVNSLRTRLDAVESSTGSGGTNAPVGYYPRKKLGADYVAATPYAISWDEVGTAFDDTGWDGPATDATHVTLPDSTGFATHFELANNNERSPYFLFHRTQGYNFVIHCQGTDVIAVDGTDDSAEAGNVAITSGNGSIGLRMMDNGWRAFTVTGEWEIDA